MSSFNADKKREHEDAAADAIAHGDYSKAFFHTIQAAKFTFNLAEQSGGGLAYAYLDDANGLIEVARKIKRKIPVSKEVSEAVASADAPEEDSNMRLIERPKERLSDISGMEEAKKFVINNVITPLKDPAKTKKYDLQKGGGLLLYGLPGTGKSFFAKAVAGELDVPFYVLDTSKVMDQFLGNSQKAIKELFDTAKKHPMSVIFIDETNGLLVPRNAPNVHETTKQVEDIILQEMDGIRSGNPVLVIGATNYPGELDDAALSRFTQHVEVGLPDGKTRRFILDRELRRMEIEFEEAAFDFLEEKTTGFSCRDVVQCAKKLKSIAAELDVSKFSLEFCQQNFVDNHVESVDVAQSIAEFKKRIGEQVAQKKK